MVEVLEISRFFSILNFCKERVVHRSQVFVNEEVTVHLHIIDTQLFFGSEQEYFKS